MFPRIVGRRQLLALAFVRNLLHRKKLHLQEISSAPVIPRLAVGSTVHPRTFGTVLYRGLADGAQLPAIINHGLRQVLSEGLSFASTGLKFTEAAPQPQFVLPTTSRVISSNNRQVVDIESLAQNDGSSSPYGALLQYTKLTQGQKRNAQASSKNVASDDAYEAVLTYAKMNV